MQSDVENSKQNWYILKTKSNCEKKVHNLLWDKGYTIFLPTFQTIRIWTDRKKKVEIPLIPTYVFVYCFEKELLEVVKTTGVAWIMRDARNYAIVKDHEIENLRIYLSQNIDFQNVNFEEFEIGETVRVIKGPFTGIIGMAVQKQGVFRLVIEINSIGTQFTINVPKSQIVKIENPL